MTHTNLKKILLVEDESSIADTVTFALKREGFDVTWCNLAQEALSQIQDHPFDFFILDIGLPDMSGFELCKALRQHSNSPLLFLTARGDEIDRVVGLEIGGDDYMTKPFSPRELVARVKVILKRMAPAESIPQTPKLTTHTDSTDTEANDFVINESQAQIRYLNTPLQLTRYEYRILCLLIKHPQHVYSREQLIQQAWDNPVASFDRAIDTHIKSIRAKLKVISPHHNPIKTHRGLGYSCHVKTDTDTSK